VRAINMVRDVCLVEEENSFMCVLITNMACVVLGNNAVNSALASPAHSFASKGRHNVSILCAIKFIMQC
jgi:hypothetical protein